ncbi:peptidoglycan bridge formation glycyltransferase FemA/FemB family protein [Candidatus Roizmanbacteria bacterium]|nr:peptidoglycan bridge formation glycyltransferase FemA/FemB family protein [Candidatus Roizmanbacteria bacterium]
MNIQEVNNKNEWEEFVNESYSTSFLQSWEWGEVKKEMGQEVLRLGLYEKEKLLAIALIEKMKSKRGRYLFVPHGPLVNLKSQNFNLKSCLQLFKNYLIEIAKKEGYIFIRIGSSLENTPQNQALFKNLGFKKAPIYIHSENFWILSLDKSEDELLAEMRKTTRYLIRKAIRDGVLIEKRTDKKALDDFYEIYEKTVKREHFSPYSKRYIKNEFSAFHESGNAIFLFGRYQGKILASALVLFTKTTACYHQGASIHTKIPVPYLLQWEAIKESKKRGCKLYNFWGILIKGRTPKDWEGLTTFKTGFGGHEIQYVPTQDYIISPSYYLTYVYEKFLQWKRGV